MACRRSERREQRVRCLSSMRLTTPCLASASALIGFRTTLARLRPRSGTASLVSARLTPRGRSERPGTLTAPGEVANAVRVGLYLKLCARTALAEGFLVRLPPFLDFFIRGVPEISTENSIDLQLVHSALEQGLF